MNKLNNGLDLETLVLKPGKHASPEEGMCVMEAVAYFAGEEHSDEPACACPVLMSFMIKLNDSLNDTKRQLLKPYIPRLVGTRDGKEALRLRILIDAAITEWAPLGLEKAGKKKLIKYAKDMRKLAGAEYSTQRDAAYAAARAANAAYAARAARADYAASAVYAVDAASAVYAANAAADAAAYAADYAAHADYAAANAADAARAARIDLKDILKVIDRALGVK